MVRNPIYVCKCGYSTINKQSYCAHSGRCKIKHPDLSFDNLKGVTSHTAWNKGLSKYTDTRVAEYAKSISESFSQPTWNNDVELNRRNKISNSMMGKYGGIRKGSGHGIKGSYKGIWCDSTYELAFVMYCIDHDIPIHRNTKPYLYKYNGATHRYYPDFIVNNNQIVEIKGFMRDSDYVKVSVVPDLIVILGEQNSKYIEYALHTYGSDFYKFYDTRRGTQVV